LLLSAKTRLRQHSVYLDNVAIQEEQLKEGKSTRSKSLVGINLATMYNKTRSNEHFNIQ